MYDFSGIWYHIIINIVLMFMCILYIIIFEKPCWSKHENYDKTRSVDENVEIIMNRKYGAGNWKKGPGSEASKVKKWLQRSRKLE